MRGIPCSASIGTRARRKTRLWVTATPFLEKANALWRDTEVTLRSKRALSLIKQQDEWLKDCGWYDIITRTLGDNWQGEDDGYIYDAERTSPPDG